MNSNTLLEQATAKAKLWLTDGYDAQTQDEVKQLLNQTDTGPLIEAFYKDLEFGTGGLRGIMGAGTNRMNRYTVAMATQGLSNYLHKAFPQEEIAVVIGYDCRHNSPFFAEVTASVFSANGIKVYLFESLRPTPEISYAIRKLNCKSGVMITASHNPKEYNGYKAYWADGAQMIAPHDRNTIAEVSKIRSMNEVKNTPKPELITRIGPQIDQQFIADVVSLSLSPEAVKKHRQMGIVYTPIHGTGGTIVPEALKQFGFSNIIRVPEQDVASGDFPTVESPNPEEPAALELAIKKANETAANLVLASDPDGDRMGVAIRGADGTMKLLNGNQICMLLIYYSIVRRKELGDLRATDYVVKTIVTTKLITVIAQRYGVQLHNCYTGFKWIADVIRNHEGKQRYIGGGEESYGFLWEEFVRDKSSVSSCCMFAELTAWALEQGLTIDQLLTKIYREFGCYLEKGVSLVRQGVEGAAEISRMMTEFRQNPPKYLAGENIVEIQDYSTLTGRILATGEEYTLDMPTTSNVLCYKTDRDTTLAIRPSGTEPKIKFYIGVTLPLLPEQDPQEVTDKLQQKAEAIVSQLGI